MKRLQLWKPAALCLFGLALVWGAIVYDTNDSENAAISQARQDSLNMTIAFREHVQRTISAIDQLMVSIIETNAEREDWYRIPDWVKKLRLVNNLSLEIGIVGPDGVVRASTLTQDQGLNVADRPQFKAHLEASAAQPNISVPIYGRISKKWTVRLSRRVQDAAGNFHGVVTIAINPEHISNFFDRVNIGEYGVVVVVGDDGIVRARRVKDSQEVGQDLSRSALFTMSKESDTGTYESSRLIDPFTRIYSYARLRDYPMIVAVGKAKHEVLATVSEQRRRNFIAGGILSAVIVVVVFGWSIVRSSEQKVRERLRTRADEMVLEQKTVLKNTLDNLSQGVLMFDSSCRLRVWNKRYLELQGLPPEGIQTGWTLRDLFDYRKSHGQLLPNLDKIYSIVLSNMIAKQAMFRTDELHNGRVLNAVQQPMPDGGSVVTLEDITERVKAETAFKESQARFSDLFELAPNGLILFDETGTIQLANDEAHRIFGYDADELKGKRIDSLIPEGLSGSHLTSANQAPKPQHQNPHAALVEQGELNGVRKDGTTFPMDISLSPLMTGKVKNICVAVRDITDRKSLARQLQQSQKMEAVGQLTGGLAHDFNNLLMIMIGNLDILQETMVEAEEAKLLNRVLEAAIRGAELTKRLLAFARRQPLQPSLTDVNKLLRGTIDLLSRTLGQHVSVTLKPSTERLMVSVDQAQLESAVVNVAINSRDAMPYGGTVTIATKACHISSDSDAAYPGMARGDYVAICISDTGSGIPPEHLARVFEPFFTTKEQGKGTGLGLSMVYGFSKQSGGGVTIDSAVGKGTTIKLLLPQVTVESSHAVAGSANDDAEQRQIRKSQVILAVDDNPDIRATVVKNLQALGYHVLEAEDADSALAKLEAESKVDLLFTDIIMPGRMDGKELAKAARARRPGIKVLYTSGYPGSDAVTGANAEIDAPLLHKPYRKQALMNAISSALAA